MNPIAGQGRATGYVERLRERLVVNGMSVATVDGSPARAELLDGYSAAVVVGGDGTLNRWLGALSASNTPVWHAPMGTENLFARTFRHDTHPDRFVAAVRRFQPRVIDLGDCGGRLFSIMASFGPDAEVVRAVSAKRTGGISRLTYAGPIAGRLFQYASARGSVECDSLPMIAGRLGMLVIANLSAYAVRLDPAWHALPDDGKLSVVHLPGRTAFGVGARLLAGYARDESIIPGRLTVDAQLVEISCDAGQQPPAIQLDGDLLHPDAWDSDRLTVKVVPNALQVLVPAD
ncbi:MAG: diacylglycerol kinase family protein [Planctomycetota bacterium]